MTKSSDQIILLTGASGYIGGRLLRRLESSGRPVRCLTRRPEVMQGRVHPPTEVVEGDLLDRASLDTAFEGVQIAYYLVHSMGGGGDFEVLDRRAAANFADVARLAGVRQIVYLGGLGSGDDLSPHLASRHEVGRTLRTSRIPTVELRASIVIGSGSASFETVRALVEHLPLIVAPRWVQTLAQPIAVEDVVDYLLAVLELERPTNAIYEVGGDDQVTYADLIREYARQRGLRRRVIATPLITPRASRLLLGLVTPVYGRVAGAMVESLRNQTIVKTRRRIRPSRSVRVVCRRRSNGRSSTRTESLPRRAGLMRCPNHRHCAGAADRSAADSSPHASCAFAWNPRRRLRRSSASAEAPAGTPPTGSGDFVACSTRSGAVSGCAAAGATHKTCASATPSTSGASNASRRDV